jgi:hypothetical protein
MVEDAFKIFFTWKYIKIIFFIYFSTFNINMLNQ